MKKLFFDLRGIKNGVCPYCGKGPIEITLQDISKFIIDESGSPIISKTTQVNSYGTCLNCGKYIGEYVRDLFIYRRPSSTPYKYISSKIANPFVK